MALPWFKRCLGYPSRVPGSDIHPAQTDGFGLVREECVWQGTTPERRLGSSSLIGRPLPTATWPLSSPISPSPCHITGEAREVTLTPIASHELGVHMVGDLLEMYRDVGIATARVLELTTIEVSPRLLVALVHWSLDDATGAKVYAFEAAYTLARFDGVWRITAIAHNEILRYRECLARIRS